MSAADSHSPFNADILVVEDTSASLRLLRDVLGAAGYRVRPAKNGELALRSANAQPPALILLEAGMPGTDGYEVCRRLKEDEETRLVPVIFISALDDERDRVMAFEAGGVDYITKPLYPKEVLARVSTHISLRRLQADLEEKSKQLFAEIKERQQAEEALRRLSITDDLTGLYNRRGLITLAEQQMKVAQRRQRGMLLLFGDVDNLKTINDTLGHSQGDRALMEIANALKESFREVDILARVGGDEFVVLVLDAPEGCADIVATRLRESLEARRGQWDHGYRLSLSIGVASYNPQAPCSLTELISQADISMYQQKQAHRLSPDIEAEDRVLVT